MLSYILVYILSILTKGINNIRTLANTSLNSTELWLPNLNSTELWIHLTV